MYGYIDTTKFSDGIKEALKGIVEEVLSDAENDINLDYVDLHVIMNSGDMMYVGIGESKGENSAVEALKLAIKDSTLDFNLLDKLTGILIHFKTHSNFPLKKISEAMEIINENDETMIIFGTTTDNFLNENYVKVSIILAGFDKKT